MRENWLPHLDARVPRYTSYPTAPHFHPGIGPEAVAGWLGAIDPARPVSLYVHVPFCRQLCWYCGCNTTIASRAAPTAGYVATLLAEIALIAERTPARPAVGHLHFGGGTPNALAAREFAEIVEALAARFRFAAGMELAVEVDPRTLSAEMVAVLAALGLTRASIGVQDLDPEVQRAINRVQPAAVVARATDELRRAGAQGINFDLLYGLPRQTVATVRRTVAQVVAMRPDRISLFGYAHVPWMKKHQKALERFGLPEAAERARLAGVARASLEAAGYVPVGLDHFALPQDELARAGAAGTLRRNFQGYTTDAAETLIGFGPSSISAFREGYAQSAADLAAWAGAVEAGRLATVRGIALAPDDRLRRELIERLMCAGAVDVEAVARAHGSDPAALISEMDRLRPLAAEGLVELDGWRVRVPGEARVALRTVAAVFDRYLAAGPARHSAAV